MEAVLAAFTKWPPECAHSIATPEPTQKPRFAPEPVFSFSGGAGRRVGPSAGAHHLAIVYRPNRVACE